MVTIRLIDDSCERYTQKRDCTCLGRRWDNIAEKVTVIKPKGEENNVCAMIMLHDNKIIDHIIVGEEPIDITSNASQYSSIQIGFSFSNETGYIKNSEVVDYYFAEAIKPTDFVPMPPTQEENINNLIGKSFVRSELNGVTLNFYNVVGDVISSVDLSGFAGGGGTVPDFVKNISEEDIESWNNKVDNTTNNLVNYYLKKDTYSKEEVNQLISAIRSLKKEIVSVLPIENIDENTIYLVPKTSGAGNDYYDEYLYINGNFEFIGSTQIDLTDYVKKTDYATYTEYGLVKLGSTYYGLEIRQDGSIALNKATNSEIDNRYGQKAILTEKLDYAIVSGLTTNKETLTDEQKTKAQTWLGVPQFKATQLEDGSYSLSITTPTEV